METHKAPYDFVPSPTELSANRFRLRAIRAIPDDSDEAKAAALNTSQQVKAAPVKPATVSEDISRIKDINTALELIKTINDEDMLDKFLLQESDNKPRPRKSILAAIEARRDELAAMPDRVQTLSAALD